MWKADNLLFSLLVSQSRKTATKVLYVEGSAASTTNAYREVMEFEPEAMMGRHSESPGRECGRDANNCGLRGDYGT